MHIRNLLLTTIGLAGLCSLPATDLQAGGLSRGAMLSASCEGCHGTNGNSPGTIPSISGRSAEYIMQALNGFHSGERRIGAHRTRRIARRRNRQLFRSQLERAGDRQ